MIALEAAGKGVTSNTVCPGYVRTPLVEGQIADQARTHGIDEDEVLDEVLLATHPGEAARRARGGGRPGRLPLRARHRLGHRQLISHGWRLDRRVKGNTRHVHPDPHVRRPRRRPGTAS